MKESNRPCYAPVVVLLLILSSFNINKYSFYGRSSSNVSGDAVEPASGDAVEPASRLVIQYQQSMVSSAAQCNGHSRIAWAEV